MASVPGSSSAEHPHQGQHDDVHRQFEKLEETDDGTADPQAQYAPDVGRKVYGLRTMKSATTVRMYTDGQFCITYLIIY